MDTKEGIFDFDLKGRLQSFLQISREIASALRFGSTSKPVLPDTADLPRLRLIIETIQADRRNLEKLPLSGLNDELFIKGLRDLEYWAEDVVDQIQFQLLQATRFEKFLLELQPASAGKRKEEATTLLPFISSDSLSQKIDMIEERFHDISNTHQLLCLNLYWMRKHLPGVPGGLTEVRRPQPSGLTEVWRPQPSSYLLSGYQLHGRTRDMKKLVDLLLADDVGNGVYSVIPIVGMAGVGKTALVQHVFHNETIKARFDHTIWVCASQHDVIEVTRGIVEVIEQKSSGVSELSLLQQALIRNLEYKRFLLVLDDVWDEDPEHWARLQVPLNHGDKGSKVIVTTRSMKVSRMMCPKNFYLDCLSENDSWVIFLERYGRNFCLNSNMIEIGRKIVARCKGVPLAVHAFGDALSLIPDEQHWKNVLEIPLLSKGTMRYYILQNLMVSYNYLPWYLKNCFAYCSLFPKSYVFEKDKLVQLWMAQGFIHPNRSSSLEEIGYGYFDDLLDICFFQHSPSHDPSEGKYVMHDLYQELAEIVSGEEYIRIEDFKTKNLNKNVRHSSMIPQEANFMQTIELGSFVNQYLRTFLLIGDNKPERVAFSLNIPRDFFPLLQSVRALDLGNTDIQCIPGTIGHLILLRYLSLESTKIKNLPESICFLFNLQTLNLKHCFNLEELPKGMKLLDNLRHLYLPLGGWSCIWMPAGMGQMTSLQTLPLIVVNSKPNGCGLEELGSLENLKGELHILGMSNVTNAQYAKEAKMQNKSKLQKLTLEWSPTYSTKTVSEVFENLKPPSNLEELIIKGFCGQRFPSWLWDNYLSKLTSLEIKNCRNAEELPSLGRLPSLKYLLIDSMVRLRLIGPDFCGHASSCSSNPCMVGFPKLETLVFKKMNAWEEWTGVERGDFPCLKKLIFNRCEKLLVVPEFPTSDSVNEKNPAIQWFPNTQIGHYSRPLLVLSECGSKFDQTTIQFQVSGLPELATNRPKAYKPFIDGETDKKEKDATQLRSTGSHLAQVDDSVIHGREYEREMLMDLLLSDASDEHNISLIFILGASGVGKTTLVRHVYNETIVSESFDTRIWVCVSKNLNENRLLKEIMESVTSRPCGIAEPRILEEVVKEQLAGKKFLLVLDDAENESESFWTNVLPILDVGAKGSFVLVTTCNRIVANVTRFVCYLCLSHLSLEKCRSMFQQLVLDLPTITMEQLVAKCGGIPLCIKMLSGLINEEGFETVSKKRLWEMDELGGGILPALRVCYDLLPTHLKQCLKYCSLFPLNFIFQKKNIVLLWASEGFIDHREGEEPEEIGIEYFDKLVARSFFETSPLHNFKEEKFVMHELIHGFAQHVSRNECFRLEDSSSIVVESVNYFSVIPDEFQTVAINPLTKEVSSLQTFIVINKPEARWNSTIFPIYKVMGLHDLFLRFIGLRTLNLSATDIKNVPKTIKLLKSLCYLGLNNTRIKRLPSVIGSLISLQTLEAKDCYHLVGLPESVTKLTSLRHLDVKRESGFVAIPRGIGYLTNLRTLAAFNVGNDSLHCSIGDLKNLENIGGNLQIGCVENIGSGNEATEANLTSKKFLKSITLQWNGGIQDFKSDGVAFEVLENLKPNTNLEELIIRNYMGNHFPSWVEDSSFSKLTSIVLDNCCKSTNIPALGKLPSLRFLSIKKTYGVKSLDVFVGQPDINNRPKLFPLLELLNIREMHGLVEIFEIKDGDFPFLCTLSISRCLMLKKIPSFPSLSELIIHCGTQLPEIPYLPLLESIKIEGFQKMKKLNVPNHLPRLKKLEISHCKELESVDYKLTPVEKLKINRCPKLQLHENAGQIAYPKMKTSKRQDEASSSSRFHSTS